MKRWWHLTVKKHKIIARTPMIAGNWCLCSCYTAWYERNSK